MQYIVLLRGINIGGRIIKMEELKSCFEKNSYQNVLVIIQTGNVIIEANEKNTTKLQKKIEQELADEFSYPASVLIITPKQLQNIVTQYPFTNYGPAFHRYVYFTEKGVEKDILKNCCSLDDGVEAVAAGENVLYWRVQKGNTLDSAFGKYASKAAKKYFLTNRNINTLEKILARCNV